MTKRNQSGQAGQQQAVALEDANEIQQEQVDEMKASNESTSKHNTAIKRLTKAIVGIGILTVGIGILTIWANYNQPGRYAILKGGTDFVWVLDTKTSQLWMRGESSSRVINLGTIKNPKQEVISDR